MPSVPLASAPVEGSMRVLLVEDSQADARLVIESIKHSSRGDRVTLVHVVTLAAAREALETRQFDCVLLDLGLPDGRGVQNVTAVREWAPQVAIVVMTGLDDEKTAVEALKLGAQEYAVKGLPAGEVLVRLLHHAIERDQMVRELNSLRQQEYHRATHDALTGLPNRQLFVDRAQQSLEQTRRRGGLAAICYIDLDGFKPVNDTHGHAVGDLLLRTVANELRDCVRTSDTVARMGGDEFAVLLPPPCDKSEAQQISQRIIERLRGVTSITTHNVRIGASIGIAVYPEHGDSLDTLMQHADLAMYSSKNAGRNTYRFYQPEMHAERELKGKIIEEIAAGLEQQQFFLHYQPWFDLKAAVVAGIEALPRWRVRGGEIRHAHLFMPAADESGLVARINRQLIPMACHQWLAWRNAGLNAGCLAYAISWRQLRDPDGAKTLAETFRKEGLEPQTVQLNLPGTEAVLQKGGELLVAYVNRLTEQGFRVMLDLLPAEPRSLAVLGSLKVQAVRLDPALVVSTSGTLAESQLARVVEVLTVADNLKIDAIVPDVETAATLQALRNVGCRYVQGFLFARPGDAAFVEHALKQTTL